MGVIDGFMESVRVLYTEDPLFLPSTDLVLIGKAYDSIDAVLARLARSSFDYHAYLKSDEWKVKRDSQIRDAGGRCQVCNSRYRLNCHHRTYERIGRELPEDLIVLCEVCHGIFHRNGRLARPPGVPTSGRTILSLEGGKASTR
jgi:hypothetical protein